MARLLENWLQSYVDYASHTEAPKIMHFYAGVWAIAGALRKKVWMDQVSFRWNTNFYIIFVAPPGIVSKSSTASIAEKFLRKLPGVKFGPDVVTWPALVTSFAGSCESFEHEGEWVSMSPLSLCASELGNLIDMSDRGMVNLFIDLWDGRRQLDKQTKGSGNDLVDNPWINMLGCTTPSWIADNMSSITVGGGFTSRCIFVYAEEKERFIPLPKYSFPENTKELEEKLLHDLEHISANLVGEYELTPEARAWVEAWYKDFWINRPSHLVGEMADGYVARRQTHMMKLSMILAAAKRDALSVTLDDIMIADAMLKEVETDMPKVFAKIGRSDESLNAERFIEMVKKAGTISYEDAYRAVHAQFPNSKDFEGIISGATQSGQIKLTSRANGFWLSYNYPERKGAEASLREEMM